MRIFPNNITESLWRKHLAIYSPTLFDYHQEYSKIVSPDIKTTSPNNIYVCPLCTKKYFAIINNEVYGNSEFSLDHLPPDSVGGKFKILTCKKCNNDAGAYEAELSKLLDFGNIPDRKDNSLFSLYVLNKQTGEKFKGIVNSSDGKTDITFNEKAKEHNKELKSFLSKLHDGKLETLQLMITSPNLDKIEKALLKSAYLACFVWWGYEFIYSKNADLLRKVLNKELTYPTRIPTLWHESKKDILPKGIGILSKNGVKEAFLVNLELKNEVENFTAAILIPNPTEAGWNKLFELDFYVLSKNLTEFDFLPIPRTISRQGYSIAWNVID